MNRRGFVKGKDIGGGNRDREDDGKCPSLCVSHSLLDHFSTCDYAGNTSTARWQGVMRRSVLKIIEEFRLYRKHCVLQSLFATVAVFVVLYFLSLQNAVIIASFGATAFIVFAMPDYVTAQPRNVIGGHLVGLFWGFVFSLIPHAATIENLVCYSPAVGLSIFTMAVTDTEHPPAAGTALGVAITGMSPNVLVVGILSIVLLSLMHRFFKPLPARFDLTESKREPVRPASDV